MFALFLPSEVMHQFQTYHSALWLDSWSPQDDVDDTWTMPQGGDAVKTWSSWWKLKQGDLRYIIIMPKKGCSVTASKHNNEVHQP